MTRNNAESLTPKELYSHVTSLMSSNVPTDFYDSEHIPLGEVLTHHGYSTLAKGSCLRIAGLMHPHLPSGSKIVQMTDSDNASEHYVHHVPTTEGPYVVDFTHAQFEPSGRSGPVVEPLGTFNERQASKNRVNRRTLTTNQAEKAASIYNVKYADVGLHREIQENNVT